MSRRALDRLAAGDSDNTVGSDLYRPLIGAWSIHSEWCDENGKARSSRGEWHFQRILGGNAIQDVLFTTGAKPSEYGTSIRAYDAAVDEWHVVWMQPESREFVSLIARSDGNGGIVHTGRPLRSDLTDLLRWSFVDIAESKFTWLGEKSNDDGVTWELEQRMFGTRIDR